MEYSVYLQNIFLQSTNLLIFVFVCVDSEVKLALTQRSETGTASCTQLDAETDDKHKLCSDLVSAHAIQSVYIPETRIPLIVDCRPCEISIMTTVT